MNTEIGRPEVMLDFAKEIKEGICWVACLNQWFWGEIIYVFINVPISVNSLVGLEKSLNGLWIYNSTWPVGMEVHIERYVQMLLLMKDIKTVRNIRQW